MNELKGEFVRSTITIAETNPDEWFVDHFLIHQSIEEDYKYTTFTLNTKLLRIQCSFQLFSIN
jgi:hypothetical protein